MKDLKALGKNVVLKTDLQTYELVTEHGIIHKTSQMDEGNVMLWSEVHSIGPDVKLDLNVGDWVHWRLDSAVGHYKVDDEPYDLVPFDRLLVVKEPDAT